MVAFIFILFIRKFNQRFQVMVVMSTMAERIQEALNAKKLSWAKAATMIGLSQPTQCGFSFVYQKTLNLGINYFHLWFKFYLI